MSESIYKLGYEPFYGKLRRVKNNNYKDSDEGFFNYCTALENFEIFEDDVWVAGYPKTGTTWLQETVWCIVNDLNFEKAKISLDERVPFFEESAFKWKLKKDYYPEISAVSSSDEKRELLRSLEYCKTLPRPRTMKTHLPYDMLPKELRDNKKGAKIIYITRNAKDACVSLHYYLKNMWNYSHTFDETCQVFLNNKFEALSFWENVNSYWERKDENKIFTLKYEEMKENLPLVLKNLSTFLDKPLNETEIKILSDHLSFNKIKFNPAVNKENTSEAKGIFIRKGESDQWKTEMSLEFIEKFDKMAAKALEDFPALRADFSI